MALTEQKGHIKLEQGGCKKDSDGGPGSLPPSFSHTKAGETRHGHALPLSSINPAYDSPTSVIVPVGAFILKGGGTKRAA